jgi:hypothetical protein
MLGVWFKLGNNIITLTDNSAIIQSLDTVLTGLLTGSVIYLFIYSFIHSFIHSPLSLYYDKSLSVPKLDFYIVRSSVSPFNLQYRFISLRLPSSCLRLLHHLPVTATLSCMFPSTACVRKQFLRQMWPIQTALLLFIVLGLSLPSFSVCKKFLTRSIQVVLFDPVQHNSSKLSRYFLSIFQSVHVLAFYKLMLQV